MPPLKEGELGLIYSRNGTTPPHPHDAHPSFPPRKEEFKRHLSIKMFLGPYILKLYKIA